MQVRADRVLDELRRVVTQAQSVLDSGTDTASRLGTGLVDAHDRVVAFEQHAARRAREAAAEMDRYAHEHPWRLVGSIAVVAGVAIALMMIASSRRD